jgi:hypothetical protein
VIRFRRVLLGKQIAKMWVELKDLCSCVVLNEENDRCV